NQVGMSGGDRVPAINLGHDQMAAAPSPSAAQPPRPQPPAAKTVAAGDIEEGHKVFRKCQACHSLQAGKELVGPSLAGIIGRKSGAEPGFSYSPAMKEANIIWDAQTLAAYLTDPQKAVPGNRMPFPGLKSDHDRADVIAFLQASSKNPTPSPATAAAPATPSEQAVPPVSHNMPDMSDVNYTLRTGIAEGRMVYLGVGGAIDAKVNPVLSAAEGQTVQITLINGEGAEHDIAFPDQNTKSPRVTGKGASTTIAFRVTEAGDFTYFCSVPGHRLAGMEGKFLVTPKPPPQLLAYADISREPTDLPPPTDRHAPQTVRVDLISVELEGRLAEGTTFGYWTFNGKVPGPFLRVRVGDRVEVHLQNSADSSMVHSVDFHAATGPGGGAAALQVNPGDEKSMTFKALVPGLYVYHCATPMVAEHIANGMYGLILVEPEEGLPKVDREFYIMQGEIYTDAAFGQRGSQEFSVEKLLGEHPEYFVFNGSVGALTALHPLHANVGETVRMFFGVGGPNFTSSFHVIGEIFDKAYDFGGVLTPPQRGIQTITVPPGGAAITEFKPEVPGNYAIVDHALARLERGLVGTLIVQGAPNPEIYDGKIIPGGGH
ncbi:MAG: copper-containing nitrite reductase, partial [Stellaceae bacterium]